MGLPNEGLAYYLDYCLARQDQQALQFLSVVGLSYDEIVENLRTIEASAYQGVTEFNLSCPNVPGKPQIAYDFELTERLLTEVFSFFTKPLGLKLPPYFDIAHFDQMAAILNRFPLTYVNCVNSIGNGLYIDVDKEQVVIKPKGGFGGLGQQPWLTCGPSINDSIHLLRLLAPGVSEPVRMFLNIFFVGLV